MHTRWPFSSTPLALLVSAVLASVVPGSPAWAQSMINAHVTSGGEQANWAANTGSISDDGRYVAFSSQATNLYADDTNGETDCFVHDNLTGATVLISRGIGGGVANGASMRPCLSSDGRYVAFTSTASNLIWDDMNGMVDIFRYDRDPDEDGTFDEPGETAIIRASVGPGGVESNGHSRSYEWAISDDGDRIVFESEATNLVPGDTNGLQDCFLRIVSAGTTTRVSVSTAGAQSTGTTAAPAISGNGLVVVVNANSSPGSSGLIPDDTNDLPDVFVRDLAAGTTTRVSVASDGSEGNGFSLWGTISDDGNLVTFESAATNLVGGDTNGFVDVFVHDRATGATERVNLDPGGAQANNASQAGAISGDGQFVVFPSMAANLVGGDTNEAQDLFVHDRLTGETVRANRAVDGTQPDGWSFGGSLTDDGASVAFLSTATNLGPGPDTNGATDVFIRGEPFLGTGGTGGGTPGDTCACLCAPAADSVGVDANPVTFSVNGPIDPHTEGILYARGTPRPLVPVIPGDPIAFGIRVGPVPQAAGIDALATPGDVFDYAAVPLPDDAVMFESTPLPPPDGAPPDGSNNQILEAVSVGLASGPAVPMPLWTSVFPPRDNIDAFSFGEDYFPDTIITSVDTTIGLMTPPFDPLTGEVSPAVTPWAARASVYAEPIVVSDLPGISYRFSVDPWALGLPATAVLIESGGADAGAGLGPWMSPGAASGDEFGTPVLARVGGVTVGGGTNSLVWNNTALALAPVVPPMMPMEDDLDALECVGQNDSTWMAPSGSDRPGHLHARVAEVMGPELPPPGLSWHEPLNIRPMFFSVTRNSPGVAGSAVRAQFVSDGGAAGDLFVTAKDPMTAAGVGTNLLFADEAEIGLYALDASPFGVAGDSDYTDDLDALILCVCEEYRPTVVAAIEEILGIAPPFTPGGFFPWSPPGPGGGVMGGGMTMSIIKYLESTGRPVPEDCIHVGFSVTTDAIGLEYTGVDYEAGPVFPPGGFSTAPGDIFYADIDGDPVNPNHLWYEEMDLGLDAGAWVNGGTMDLAALSDNLNALDAINFDPDTTDMSDPGTGVDDVGSSGRAFGLDLGQNLPNPFNPFTTMAYSIPRRSHVSLAVYDAQGRRVATLVDGIQEAGRHVASWNGEGDDGARATSGIYFARLESGGESRTRKIVLVK